MNTQALILALESISSDSQRNTLLEKLVSQIDKMTWHCIPAILKCYSANTYKVTALKIIVSCEKFDPNNISSEILSKILCQISADTYKISAIKILKSKIHVMTEEMLLSMIDSISANTYIVDAIKIIWSDMKSQSIGEQSLLKILRKISSDSYRVDAIKCLRESIHSINNETIIAMMNSISSDSYKVDAIKYLNLNLNLNSQNICSINNETIIAIMNSISSDSYKVDLVKFLPLNKTDQSQLVTILQKINSSSGKMNVIHHFCKNNLKITSDQLLDILQMVSSNSDKVTIISEFSNKLIDRINNDNDDDNNNNNNNNKCENFCKSLAEIISDQENYLAATNILALNDLIVQKYKPIQKTVSIDSVNVTGVDLSQLTDNNEDLSDCSININCRGTIINDKFVTVRTTEYFRNGKMVKQIIETN